MRYMGPSGSGETAKACNQIIVAATVTAVSEAMLLFARTSGLDLHALMEILGLGGLARSEVLAQKGDKWIAEDYTPGGSATNQLKDLRFIEESAHRAHGLRLPVTDAVTASCSRRWWARWRALWITQGSTAPSRGIRVRSAEPSFGSRAG